MCITSITQTRDAVLDLPHVVEQKRAEIIIIIIKPKQNKIIIIIIKIILIIIIIIITKYRKGIRKTKQYRKHN